MATTLLVDKVRAITKSTITETSTDNIVSFLNAGSKFTVMSIPKNILWFLVADGTDITDGNGQTVSADVIFEVRRNNIVCDKIETELAHQVSYVGSLYEATSFFPKYYIRSGKVYIKPDPTVSAVGVISTVTPPIITDTTDSDSITYSQIENIIILYASALDFTALANHFSRQTTSIMATGGAAKDALEKAQKLIDDQSGVGGDSLSKSAQGWITEDDSEMTQVTVQAAAQEVQRAIAEMESGKEYSQEAQMYFQKADQYFKMAQIELNNYINSNPEIMAMQQQAATAGENK